MAKQFFPLGRNLSLLSEAFRGKQSARDMHRSSLRRRIDIQSGLSAIATRWPELHSRNTSAPVFIFSAGWRSGSTFLQRWLMTSEHILIWGEPYRHAALIESLSSQLKAFTMDWPRDQFFAEQQKVEQGLTNTWVANLYPALQSLMDAHVSYFETLFSEPARIYGKAEWGFKEVTLGVEHAQYLRWLFPNAKFLFLYRDPYNAYGSYRRWGYWYRTWPDQPVFTASRFGSIWKELAADFVDHYHEAGGMLLKYEDLRMPETRARLEDYLGFALAEASSLTRVGAVTTRNKDAGMRSRWVPKLEMILLKRQVEPLRTRLGYD